MISPEEEYINIMVIQYNKYLYRFPSPDKISLYFSLSFFSFFFLN